MSICFILKIYDFGADYNRNISPYSEHLQGIIILTLIITLTFTYTANKHCLL